MTLNLGKIRRDLRKKLRFDVFLFRLIFKGISFYKIVANFEFLAKTALVSDLFLNVFLCEKEDQCLSAGSKLELSTTYTLFGRWMVVGPTFGSLNL